MTPRRWRDTRTASRDGVATSLTSRCEPLTSQSRRSARPVGTAGGSFAPSLTWLSPCAGGGVASAEERGKEGGFGLEPSSPGTRPYLTGLSCRFDGEAWRHAPAH